MLLRSVALTTAVFASTACHPQMRATDANYRVGSLSLHLRCAGQGEPPVVLDSGPGQDARAWDRVQPEVARFTRACAYDRAGLGGSSAATRPHTNAEMAAELRALLKAAAIEGPYVLAGHSMGGLNIRLFAGAHPEAVAGMVFVDSMTRRQSERYWGLIPEEHMKQFRDGVGKLPEGIDFDLLAKDLADTASAPTTLGVRPVLVLTR